MLSYALRDDADEVALGDGVGRCQELGPHRSEVHGDHAGEADRDADQRQRREPADRPESGSVCQPTTAAARRRTINTPAALSVPLTVMTCECQALTGPSVIGVARVDGSGAPQPGLRAAWFQVFSLKMGFAMHASLGERGNKFERYSRLRHLRV